MDKDKQMEFLFEEGGITDDGMTRDPISGNEVPPGSLAKEVRDDIPAALSEGEYVVPADVVRYYGVKFFEDLRSEAKQGLSGMERDGRIGGEPIDMEEELSPEERAELEALTGFNEGGLAETQAGFNPLDFRAGFSFLGPSKKAQATTVTLYGPNGEIQSVMFPSEQYDTFIAQGYTTEQPGATVTSEVSEEVRGSEDSGDEGYTTFSGQAPRDLSELSNEELESNLTGLSTMSRIGGALAVAVNPVFGKMARAALGSSSANIVAELERRGVDMSDYRAEHGRDIYGGGLTMYDGLQDQPGSRSGVDFGDTWLGDLMGFDGKAGVQGPGLKESREGARRSAGGGSSSSSNNNDRDRSDRADNSNVGNWGGDRDGDGVPNAFDFDDGVGWADKNKD